MAITISFERALLNTYRSKSKARTSQKYLRKRGSTQRSRCLGDRPKQGDGQAFRETTEIYWVLGCL